MPSHYDQAGEAIGQAVERWQQPDAHNWGNKVPATHWSMDRGAWRDMLSEILGNFAELIHPCEPGHSSVFDGTRKKEMYLLQRLMAETVRCDGDDDE
jgi:hypothetical protein